MVLIKQPLSIRRRLACLKHGITGLAQTSIKIFDHDTKKWHVRRWRFSERLDLLTIEIDTALHGYVYAGLTDD